MPNFAVAMANDRDKIGSGEIHGVVQVLHRSSQIMVGRYTCPPGHPLWSQDNAVGPWPIVAIPGPSVEIRMAGHRAIVGHAGVATLYNPGQHYARRIVDARGDRCVFVSVEPTLLRELLAARDPSALDRQVIFVDPRTRLTPTSYLTHKRLVQTLEREAPTLAVEEAVLKFLDGVLSGEGPDLHGRSEGHRALAHALEQHVAARICDNDDLAALAGAVGASPWHAARVFRACTGESLHALRDRLRVSYALERLEDPTLDLATLALDLGYSSHSHFTTAFRRVFGCAPSTMRHSGQRRRRLMRGEGARRP